MAQLVELRLIRSGKTEHWPLETSRGTHTSAMGRLVRVSVKRSEPDGSLSVKATGSTSIFSTMGSACDMAAGPTRSKNAAARSAQATTSPANPVCLLIDSPFPSAQLRLLLVRELSTVMVYVPGGRTPIDCRARAISWYAEVSALKVRLRNPPTGRTTCCLDGPELWAAQDDYQDEPGGAAVRPGTVISRSPRVPHLLYRSSLHKDTGW